MVKIENHCTKKIRWGYPMISYLTIFTGQVIQKCWAGNMITFTYKIKVGNMRDGLTENTL